MAVSWTSFAIALALLAQVLDTGTISYALGGWAAPWGIEYRVDTANAFVLVIVSGISSIVLPYAKRSVEKEIASDRIYIFYTAWLLCLTGMLGMTVTGDAFNVFVFLEISSLSSYLLISLGTRRRALTAAFQYLVLGTIGATFILIAIGLMYMMTGTLNMLDMATRLQAVNHTRTIQTAFAFLTIGIALKAAIFPFHAWLANAYANAPSAVAAFLAGTTTKVAVYLLLRFFFTVYSMDFSIGVMELDRLLLPLALAGILIPSTVAIYQTDVKRMLGYSSVAQIAYMVLGISMASITGLTATMIHLFNHALMKTALFLSLGCIAYRIGSVRLDDMAGIGRRMPWTMGAFVFGGLSLIGLPMTAGFISKWYLILAALQSDMPWVAGLVLASSLLAVFYVWRVVESAYFHELDASKAEVQEAPWSMLVPTWLLIAANVWFGIDARPITDIATRAALVLGGQAL